MIKKIAIVALSATFLSACTTTDPYTGRKFPIPQVVPRSVPLSAHSVALPLAARPSVAVMPR